MELRQLKYFSAVAQQLSFTNAAQTLFVSQSAISQQISALENELGIQLLVRDKHAVSLTQAGAEFYQNLQSILSTLDSAVESAQVTDRARHYAARMTVGIQAEISISRAFSPLIRALQQTQKAFPHLIVDVKRIVFDQVEPSLLNGKVDFVVALDPAGEKEPFSKRISYKPFVREKLVLCVSRKLLADDFGVGPLNTQMLLSKYPLNLDRDNSAMITRVFSIYRHHGLLPNICYYDNPIEAQLRARLGYGICLSPETLTSDAGSDEFFRYFDLECDNAAVTRNILWRPDAASEPLQYLLDLLF